MSASPLYRSNQAVKPPPSRLISYKEFKAACDLKGDLYDYVGHLKLVNGQTLNDSVVLDEEEIASTRRVLLHVQTHDGPVMKLYLWDLAAADFCAKFNSHGSTPRVILVTTVNPKRFGGALALASVSSSRCFWTLMFNQPVIMSLGRLDPNLDVANRIDAKVVTKTETVTMGELFSYIKQEAAKVAWFECTTTVDAVVHGSPWYYMAAVCAILRQPKGLHRHVQEMYLTKLSVYDNNDQAVLLSLVKLGELIGNKHLSWLRATLRPMRAWAMIT
ncbi:hypothetical protein Bca52824_041938 [Brassica carinata]|uniref:Uncharacterized protein n=1 Tax=Brassica carinata TaxID=52824 RepID=A0A8X7S0L5_BRACI|nr:hypothetical protein Bca52824_041938 [Brassica carinata]